MNTPSKNTEIEMRRSSLHIIESGNQIIRQLQESSRGFETFFSLLSHTVWQSPLELAEAWIYLVAKEDYMILLQPDEDLEIQRAKSQIRTNIVNFVSEKIHIFYENPTFLQQLKSKFLVLHTLVQNLPITDQDRILAKHIGIPYRTWQNMLGLFSHYPEFLEVLKLENTNLFEGIDDSGETGYILGVPEVNQKQTDSIGSIVGIQIEEQLSAEVDVTKDGRLMIRTKKTPAFFITETVLRRYEKVIGMEQERSEIRTAMRGRLDDISVWKRRFGGGGSSRREPAPKLVPEGRL
ncbi:TPA: hypothetical protein DCZ36_03045 [Candidatus Gracilibacteria bacterium]|nr:hypothetical protein [Candidatus Gracilibacteria bacterium]